MYIALCLMLAGMLLGRIFRRFIPERPLSRLIFLAILFLLFLLGGQIGINAKLFADLPRLGVASLLLMLACVAGSILLVILFGKCLAFFGLRLNGSNER